MGFFDNLGKSLSDAGQNAIQKGKELADVAKFNSLISDEEKKAAGIYEQLGRKYVEVKGDAVDDCFQEYIDALKASEEQIKEYQKKLIEIKRVTQCPSCGAEVPNGSLFCAVCGAKIAVQTQPDSEETKQGEEENTKEESEQ